MTTTSRFVLAVACVLGSFGEMSVHAQTASQQTPPQQTPPQFDRPFDRRLDDLHPTQVQARSSVLEFLPDENALVALFGDEVKTLLNEDPTDDRVRSLKKERCKVAFLEVEARRQEFLSGRAPASVVLKSSSRLACSLMALDPEPATRIAILENMVKVALQIEDYANRNLKSGTGTVQEVAQAKYERLSAEIVLEEAKAAGQ